MKVCTYDSMAIMLKPIYVRILYYSRDSNPDGSREETPMELEEKVWEILLSADKKDYERICAEYGITDFRGMLKKLTEMKKEREEEIAEVCCIFVSPFSLDSLFVLASS